MPRFAPLVAALLGCVAGCTTPTVIALPVPIPLSLEGGLLHALGSTDDLPTGSAPFSLLVDTNAPITAYDDVALGLSGGPELVRARLGTLRVWSAADAGGALDPVPRVELAQITMFQAPLSPVGIDGGLVAIHGVLGGDNLARFSLALDLRSPAQVTFLPRVTTCGCDLADQCQAVLPVTVAGGADTLVVAASPYSYPGTRVLIDACLEPIVDPVSRDVPCYVAPGNGGVGGTDPAYVPSGVDVKLVVASGFPGFALGGGAYDRLRGSGASTAALKAPDTMVRLADGSSVPAARRTIGGNGLSALALPSHELFFGPCAELARSRRLRRDPGPGAQSAAAVERLCLRTRASSQDRDTQACAGLTSAVCDDTDVNTAVASVVEFTDAADVLVIDDANPLLTSVNEDVRPGNPSVDGIIGATILARMVSTIDYANGRLIARCADDAGCVAYPRYTNGSECSRDCTRVSALYTASPKGGLCPKADMR